MIVRPFKALRATPQSAPRVASVPYDVVDTAEARALAADNPVSFLRVVRPEIDFEEGVDAATDAVYHRATANLQRLQADGHLVMEPEPCLFAYRLTMGSHRQLGVLGCCSMDEYDRGVLKKHELTRQDKEDDRTRHMLAIGAQPGPVLMTYRESAPLEALLADATAEAPLLRCVSENGVQHEVWKLEEFAAIVRAFDSIPCAYIADGHHRSASAARARQALRDENPKHRGDEEYNFFLTALFPASQMKILAYNRVVRDLAGMSVEQFLDRAGECFEISEAVTPVPRRAGDFGVYVAGTWHRLTIKPALVNPAEVVRSLDCSLLQEHLIEPLLGVGDIRTDQRIAFVGGSRGTEVLEQMVQNSGGVAFSLFPTTIEQLMAVSDAGEIMPPKSTWFEPKLRSGLVVHPLK